MVNVNIADFIKIPVIMYHSVNNKSGQWQWDFLSLKTQIFEKEMQYLVRRGYHTINLQELFDYMNKGSAIPAKSIILTFDDGYLDNWVNVYPILKKYGLKATIFVNCDFVDPTSNCRLNLEDVWSGKYSKRDLSELGFLSWKEMQKMEAAGIMDIQSHALTHTWYFKESKIVDFFHPGAIKKYPWVAWNVKPERKYLWMTENQEDFVPYGTPIYEYEKSLITRQYFDDQGLKDALIQYVADNEGKDFFKDNDWRKKLLCVVDNYMRNHTLNDRYETEEEYIERVRYELTKNKKMIEERLGKEVKFLCWPGGAYNETTTKIAKERGYIASTIKEGENSFGDASSKIHRIYSGNLFRPFNFSWCYVLSLAYRINKFKENRFCLFINKLSQTYHSAKERFPFIKSKTEH